MWFPALIIATFFGASLYRDHKRRIYDDMETTKRSYPKLSDDFYYEALSRCKRKPVPRTCMEYMFHQKYRPKC